MRHLHHLWRFLKDGRTVKVSLIATVASLLIASGYLRAQAPGLSRDVPPMLPVKQVAYIKASNTEAYDHFACGGGNQGHTGTSISMSGDGNTMAVGAPFESGGAKGVNGNQNDNSVYAAGAVYVYARQGNAWTQQAYVKASNPGLNDHFGSSVAVSRDGNTMAVAAHWEASAATGVNGNQNDDSLPQAGAVYVFTRTGTTWTQQAYLKSANQEAGDLLGFSVALSLDGNTLGVGAFNEDGSGRGINPPDDNKSLESGALYVFTRQNGTWSQQAYIKASRGETSDGFGFATSMSEDGNTIAVGSGDEACLTPGIDPPGCADDAPPGRGANIWVGAAYVFTRSGATWSEQSFIKAPNARPYNSFGVRLALSGDGNTLAVSSYLEDSAARGVRPPMVQQFLIQAIFNAWREHRNEAEESGAAYIFTRSGTKWTAGAYIKGDNTDAGDEFGSAVAISGDGHTIVVGAHQEDSAARGVDGNQADNSAADSGAAYVFAY